MEFKFINMGRIFSTPQIEIYGITLINLLNSIDIQIVRLQIIREKCITFPSI